MHTTLLLLFYKRFFCFCFAELGKDERFRGKFKKKEGNKTGLSIKKVPQRLKVAGDDPDAKMTGYLHKVYYTFRISGFFVQIFYKAPSPCEFFQFFVRASPVECFVSGRPKRQDTSTRLLQAFYINVLDLGP